MTISTVNSSETFMGNGATTVFSFNFVGAAPADLEVLYTDASVPPVTVTLSPSVYTLALNAPGVGQLWGVGGTVTYPTGMSPTPIATGTSITVNRTVPYEQTISIGNQGAFYPQAVEQALDLLEMQIQQLLTLINEISS